MGNPQSFRGDLGLPEYQKSPLPRLSIAETFNVMSPYAMLNEGLFRPI